MSSILQILETRRVAKSFKSEPIPDTLLDSLVDVVVEAPSYKNFKPWRVVLITAEEQKRALAKVVSSSIEKVPLLFIFMVQSEPRFLEIAVKDVMSVAAQVVLAAESFGLGSCFFYDWEDEVVKKNIGASADQKTVAVLGLGYVLETEKKAKRLPRKQLFFKNNFQTPYQFCPRDLRSPREKAMGLVHLPRLIDKVRLAEKNHLPGYNYITIGFDKFLLDLLEVNPEEFVQTVKTASNDEVIYQWLKEKAKALSQAEKEIFNQRLLSIGPSDPARAERFRYLLDATDPSREDIKSFMELIDLMEGRI